MADVPVPGEELTPERAGSETGAGAEEDAAATVAAAIPVPVLRLLTTLWGADHAAFVVGGSVRDVLMGRQPGDWDLATSALPEQTQALFPAAVYENAFGTVAVATHDPAVGEVEITTFRSDHDYADHRRPHRVEFTDTLELDLARRDVTVNAIAWGAPAGGPLVSGPPRLVDPYGGRADIAAAVLRTVGEPRDRFEEDALRMLRVVRFAATLGFDIEAATLAGIQARAELVGHLSGERIAEELRRILAAPVASVGLRLLADTGLLAPISPELAAQRGIPQNKVPGEDLWDHTLRAVDGASSEPPYIRLAALLHDIGKPATMADGRFLGHDAVGAGQADDLLERLRWPRHERERVVHIIRNHMYGYVPTWSDAAVRRFIAKIGRDALDDLFLLREADNLGSGRPREGGGLAEIRGRVEAQLASGVVLSLHDLAVDGEVLMAELGLAPSPRLGALLDALLERAIADPAVNTPPRLLALARSLLAEGAEERHVIELLLEAERALSFGLVDRAEQLYQQVADADPRNSIAVVGLARVALERRDDLGAYLLARRALTIDPENDAARRLATRLEEVLATRGEPVEDPMPVVSDASPTVEPAAAPVNESSAAPVAKSPPIAAPPTAAPSISSPRTRRSLIGRITDRLGGK